MLWPPWRWSRLNGCRAGHFCSAFKSMTCSLQDFWPSLTTNQAAITILQKRSAVLADQSCRLRTRTKRRGNMWDKGNWHWVCWCLINETSPTRHGHHFAGLFYIPLGKTCQNMLGLRCHPIRFYCIRFWHLQQWAFLWHHLPQDLDGTKETDEIKKSHQLETIKKIYNTTKPTEHSSQQLTVCSRKPSSLLSHLIVW